MKVNESSTLPISLSHRKHNPVTRLDKLKACSILQDTYYHPPACPTVIKADSIGSPLTRISFCSRNGLLKPEVEENGGRHLGLYPTALI